MRLEFTPDEIGSEQTGDPAGDENTDSGQSNDPSSRSNNRDAYVSKGIQIGVDRILKKLGFSDLDTARQEIEAMRTSDRTDAPDGDDKTEEFTAKFQEARKESLMLKRELEKSNHEIALLRQQSDEARVMKLRAIALENGVGKGKQLDAFIRLYGDDISFDESRNLVVLTQLPDGSREPMGEPVEDFVKKALEDSPFLKPYDGAKGTGSRAKPTGSSNPSQISQLAQEVFGSGSSSGRDRIFGRRKDNDNSK